MNVVLRTSHGEAEISLGDSFRDATIAELVDHVTGEASPPVLFVDDRALPSTTKLNDCGLLEGSLIATSEPQNNPGDTAAVEFVQIAGRGAGASALLSPGRYEIGPGQRLSASELDSAPVDYPTFELLVDANSSVSLCAREAGVRINGHVLATDVKTPWRSGVVDASGRVFELAHPDQNHRAGVIRRRSADTGAGRTTFTRPFRQPIGNDHGLIDNPTLHAAESDRQRSAHPNIAGAAKLARDTDPRLWERRPGDIDAFHIPLGLADASWTAPPARDEESPVNTGPAMNGLGPLPVVPVVADLSSERGIGIVGHTKFTNDLARGLLIEAAVTHGPSDLNILVLTAPDRIHEWEWAKWLPHTRAGDVEPRLLFTEAGIAQWVAALGIESGELSHAPSSQNGLTLIVVDEAKWWRDRASPLRSLINETNLPLRFVMLARTTEDIPAVCSVLVQEQPNDLATVSWPADRHRMDQTYPFFASIEVAAGVARHLAPLDDPDLGPPKESKVAPSPSLVDLLGIDEIDAKTINQRWTNADCGLKFATPVGSSNDGPIELDLTESGTNILIAGSGARIQLRNLIVGLASRYSPADLNFVLFDTDDEIPLGGCSELPHTVETVATHDKYNLSRAIKFLRAEVARRANNECSPRLMLVVDEINSATIRPELLPDLIAVLDQDSSSGVHLVIATEQTSAAIDEALTDVTAIRIALPIEETPVSSVAGADQAEQATLNHPSAASALLATAGQQLPFQTSPLVIASHDVRGAVEDAAPFVIGRGLSAMEQRLRRTAPPHAETLPALDPLRDAISEAAAQLPVSSPTSIVPAPLPENLSLRTFLDSHPGDGIPFAMHEAPGTPPQRPAWWSPIMGSGLLAYGADGTGKTSLLASLGLGIAERHAADDVHLYCIAASSSELTALALMPHTGVVLALDDIDGIVALMNLLDSELNRRVQLADEMGGPQQVAATEATTVLMLDDIGSLRASLTRANALGHVWNTIERLAGQGRDLGFCLLATARQPHDVPSRLAEHINAQLVMRLDERASYADLGLSEATGTQLAPGRARRVDDGSELQIVQPPDDITAALAAIAPEQARDRPPEKVDHT